MKAFLWKKNVDSCLISNRRSSIDQILIKTKHKVKWMVKFAKSTSPTSHARSFLSKIKHLGKIKLDVVFSLKKIIKQTKI